MTHSQRLSALKSVYDLNPTGYLSNYIVLNFGRNISGYFGRNQYFASNGCAEFSNPDNYCSHNNIAYSNDSDFSDRTIYKVFNANHLALITIQIVK